MPKPYPRRDCVLRAFYTLVAGCSTSLIPTVALADGDTLWELLAAVPTAPVGSPALPPPNTPVRRNLGPVPGFSLLAPPDQSQVKDPFGSKVQRSSGTLGMVGDWFQHLKRMTGTSIKIEGNQNLSFRAENVSGNSESYRSATYFGRGNNGLFYRSDLTIDATLFKHFHYRTQINNDLFINPNDPSLNRVKLDYRDKRTRFEWGDIQAGFQGNSLVDFSRFLNGFSIEHGWAKNFRTKLLYSTTRAETRTITIPGNGSSGPYYVFAGLIVDGTAQVRVNERTLSSQEYTLSPQDGRLEFRNGRVILPTDTIAISFETIGFGQQRGNIYGGRLEYDLTPGFKLGLTNVMQTAQGTGLPQAQTRQFVGFETPGAAYVLDAPIDLSKPVTVTINGILMQQGVDYIIEPNLRNQIRIVPAVPRTQQILITYTPMNLNPVPGNRSVLGLDAVYTLGKLGRITAETAFSGLAISGNNIGGNGMQLRAELTPLRGLRTNLTYRDISPTYSSIQTPGFSMHEKSAQIDLDYTPKDNLRFGISAQRSVRPSYANGFGVSQFSISETGKDLYNQYTMTASYSFAKNKGTVNLSRNNLETRFALGGKSTNTSDTLGFNYAPLQNLNFDFSLSRNISALAPGSGSGSTGSLFASDSSTMSQTFRVNYTPKEWLSLRGSVSNNAITSLTSTGQRKTDARNAEVGLQLTPRQGLNITYSLGLSDTGDIEPDATNNTGGTNNGNNSGGLDSGRAVRALQMLRAIERTRQVTAGGSGSNGTSTNFGSYYGGGANAGLGVSGNYSGFYGNDVNTGYLASGFGGRNITHRFGVNYTANSRLSLAFNYDQNSSMGAYLYNSNRNNMFFNASWRPNKDLTLDINYTTSANAFIGNQGGSNANAMGFRIAGNPFGGKLNMDLSMMMQRTGGLLSLTGTGGTTIDTSQTSTNMSARLEYPIGRGRTLFASLNQLDTSGYLGSANTELRLGFGIPIYRLAEQDIMLNLSWQMWGLTNKDPQQAQFNYRVGTFAAEIGFNFRTR